MNYITHQNTAGVETKEIPCIPGSGAPTSATEGAVGCLYMDTLTGKIYRCTSAAGGVYGWQYNIGDTGAAGPQGPQGDTGAQGPQGEKGDTGPAGADGAKGDKGDKGDTGDQGPQGEKGDTGPQGPKGDTGAPGADGKDGYTPVKGVDYFTEVEKADIVAAVMDSIGCPVFGVVDEDNNIVLTGALPDGTYSVKYEMKDGTTLNIGDMVLDTNVYYSVTNTLTDCTSSNSETKVVEGTAYSATITAKDGYKLSSVNVTMGGTDVSATAVSGGTITISNVTGNIVITAVAVEDKPAYNNLADPTSADWAKDSRVSSSGAVKNDEPGVVVTNYIPVTKGQTIHIKGGTIETYNHAHYDSDKVFQVVAAYSTLVSNGQIAAADYDPNVTLYKNVGQNSSTDPDSYYPRDMVYARLTIKPTNAESDIIVTVDENIV